MCKGMKLSFRKLKNFLSMALLSAGVLFLNFEVFAYNPSDDKPMLVHKTPKELEGIGIDEKVGEQIDLGLEFMDDEGSLVTLGSYFDNSRPVFLTMVYYNCPSLCNLHLNGLTEAFQKMNWTAGVDFKVIAISMDSRETPKVSAPKKANYIKKYGRPEAGKGWHFLTGTEENVQKIAENIGFRFKWVDEDQMFAHAAAGVVLTPGGQISRYLHGIQFSPQTLKLSLLEASDGKIGSIVDQVLMFCFQFDPKKNKYTLYAWNLMRLGGLVTVILISSFLVPYWLRELKKRSLG